MHFKLYFLFCFTFVNLSDGRERLLKITKIIFYSNIFLYFVHFQSNFFFNINLFITFKGDDDDAFELPRSSKNDSFDEDGLPLPSPPPEQTTFSSPSSHDTSLSPPNWLPPPPEVAIYTGESFLTSRHVINTRVQMNIKSKN